MHRSRFALALSLLFRIVVASTFGLASVLKLRDPSSFAENISNYQLLPELSNFIAITLPSIELIAALALVVLPKPWRNAAAIILFGLLAVFTAAISRAWVLGINLECGCFGAGSTHIGIWPVLRNLGLMTALLLGSWLDLRGDPMPARPVAA